MGITTPPQTYYDPLGTPVPTTTILTIVQGIGVLVSSTGTSVEMDAETGDPLVSETNDPLFTEGI